MKLTPFFLFFIFISICLTSTFSVQADASNVLVVEITGTIDQSTVELFTESIHHADAEESSAIILLLDTPGGGLTETFDIADMINESAIPIVGYVFPSGSAAWSAGTFILMSTHVASMGDHTVIGSCQPVEIGIDGTKLVNDSKRINALVKWMETRANMYGRNKTIAAQFITKNLNVNETEALTAGVIEIIASSIDQLLEQIDGRTLVTSVGNVTLRTADAEKIYHSPSLKVQILQVISNPTLTSLLLMLGIFSLIFGISSPGYGAEVFGVVAILLSFVGSGFAVSTLGIIFIIIGCLLLIIEIFVTPGFGVIGIGGMICLVMGSIFFIPSYSIFSIKKWMITMDPLNDIIILLAVAGLLLAIFFGFLLYKVIQIRKKKAAIGIFVGETAKTIDKITPQQPGYVRFKGEYWHATSDVTIEPNTKVVIVNKDESTLLVKPMEK